MKTYARIDWARREESMKCIGWKMSSGLAACLLTMLVMARPTSSLAQEAGASIHGHVTNPIGQPLNKGEVKLTTDRTSPSRCVS